MPRVWFHLIVTTYGSWLPGDPRGFRTWHHTEHVEGDYKTPPPPGMYAERHQRAKNAMNDVDIVIPNELRPVVGTALRAGLEQEGGRVLVVSVSARHVHVQTELDGDDARIPMGKAKLKAWHAVQSRGWTHKLWAKRCKVVRIRDRAHQRRVYRYILAHRDEGAWVWSELE
jgi:hypothetical protein